MNKQKHLNLEARTLIETLLNEHHSFKSIARQLGKDCTTISKEIKAHICFEKTGALGRAFNDCHVAFLHQCSLQKLCQRCTYSNSKLCWTCGKCIGELSNPILTKEEFERKQIEKLQEENCEKANELWKDTLNNIAGLVYPHKWEYLNYLEEIRYRTVSILTLQQVKEPILSFEEFNEMMERERVRPVEAVGNVQDAVVVKEAEETIGIEKNPTEDLEVQDISILESTVEEVAVMEPVIERPLTIGERAKEISTVIRNDYGRYDNVPVKVKAELFQFSVDDFEADMKLHSLVLKELNVRMYSSELYDDYMSVVDAMDKKPVEEQNVNYYNNEKLWNRGR